MPSQSPYVLYLTKGQLSSERVLGTCNCHDMQICWFDTLTKQTKPDWLKETPTLWHQTSGKLRHGNDIKLFISSPKYKESREISAPHETTSHHSPSTGAPYLPARMKPPPFRQTELKTKKSLKK